MDAPEMTEAATEEVVGAVFQYGGVPAEAQVTTSF